jgi:mannose-6-phosphate isomerase-like protein (cupin superfamily)
MQLVQDDFVPVPPGTRLDHSRNNPLVRLTDLVAQVRLAAERQAYLAEHTQYLFPFAALELAGPQGGQWQQSDPTRQDDKADMQKQLVLGFRTTDVYLARGWATAGDWTGPFLRLSYDGGPDSRLSEMAGHALGPAIKVWLKVGDRATPELLTAPYNPESARYEVELWGYPGNDLERHLEDRARGALARGELAARPDLIVGSFADFAVESAQDRMLAEVAPGHTMHPILPLPVEVAWCDRDRRFWDNQGGGNYHYQFNMLLRGRDHYLATGLRPAYCGGAGSSHVRTLFSNYAPLRDGGGLGRQLPPWSFDAFGRKADVERSEDFLSVEHMELVLVKSESGIGLHRHRDNQEVFLLVGGHALVVVGDWCKMPSRERCFEVRTLRPGDLVLIKPGNLHGLLNPTDADAVVFAFGGYD